MVKTAIVIHGGAVKGAFAAGVMCGLSKIGIKAADLVIGVSSGVPTAAYFMSRQLGFGKKIWTEEVGSKEFIDYTGILTGKPVFDIDHLIEFVFKKKYPLEVGRILDSKSTFLIPLYNYREGKTEFISNHEEEMRRDFWKILRAAITVHDKHLDSSGAWEKFVDADLDPFALYREEIIPKRWRVLVIINHKEMHHTLKQWMGVKIFRLLHSKHFPEGVKTMLKIRGKLVNSGLKLFEKFREEYNPIIISPPPEMRLAVNSLLVRNKNKIVYLFKKGEEAVANLMNDAKIRRELEVFIERSNELSSIESQFSSNRVS